jgi:hypothetical protein
MTGRTESTGPAGKQEEVLLPTRRTADAGEATHGIAAVEACCEDRSDEVISCPLRNTLRLPKPFGPHDDLRSHPR